MLLLTVLLVSLCENLHLKKIPAFVRVDVVSYFVNLQQLTNDLAYTSEGEQRVNMV